MARRGKRTVVRAAIGAISILSGMLLEVRPFTSHSFLVLAIASGLVVGAAVEAVQGTKEAPARWVLGGSYFGAAVVISVWPSIPVELIGVIVGAVLVATGALEVWSGMLSRVKLPALLVAAAAGGPWVALFSGGLTLAMGVVTMLWQDPVVLPMVITLGLRLVLVGVGLLIDLWYPNTGYGASREGSRFLWRAIALASAVAVFASIAVGDARQMPSGFYYRDVAAETAGGELLRAAQLSSSDSVTVVQMLYSTQDLDGKAVIASAVLYVPRSTATAALPLVVWAHAETGVGQGCAPSVMGIESGGLKDLNALLDRGYAVLAPDYSGLGTRGVSSFMIGTMEARSILDGIRATGKVPGIKIGPAVVWGYSQGGHAALWTGELASSYAPDVQLAGVVADQPLTNPGKVLNNLIADNRPLPLGAFLLQSYADRYPEVQTGDYLNPIQSLLVGEVAAGCGRLSGTMRSAVDLLGAGRDWHPVTAGSALNTRIMENVPAGKISVPTLVLQGGSDRVITRNDQDSAVAKLCTAGSVISYHVYPSLDHQSAWESAQRRAEVLDWIAQRFAGHPTMNTCPAG